MCCAHYFMLFRYTKALSEEYNGQLHIHHQLLNKLTRKHTLPNGSDIIDRLNCLNHYIYSLLANCSWTVKKTRIHNLQIKNSHLMAFNLECCTLWQDEPMNVSQDKSTIRQQVRTNLQSGSQQKQIYNKVANKNKSTITQQTKTNLQ